MRLLTVLIVICAGVSGCSAQTVKHGPVRAEKTPAAECKDGATGMRFEDSAGKLHDSFGSGDNYDPLFAAVVCRQGKWIKDEAATKIERDKEAADNAKAIARGKHIHDLWIALRTRIISDSEMKEVLELGTAIIPDEEGGHTRGGCGGDCRDWEVAEAQKTAAAETVLNNALLNQFKMRTFAKDK